MVIIIRLVMVITGDNDDDGGGCGGGGHHHGKTALIHILVNSVLMITILICWSTGVTVDVVDISQ